MGKIITPGHPDFYINKRNYIEVEPTPAATRVEGWYTLQRIKPGYGVIEELSFPNLITDIGMNAFGGNYSPNYFHVGTSTSPPSNTDTSLGAFGASFNVAGDGDGGYSNSGPPDYYARKTVVKKSNVGGATGNWTEIAVSPQAGNGNILSRALILDSAGNPTTFTVLSDEQMQASYELRHYPVFVDDVRTVTISGASKNTITRVCEASNWAWQNFSEIYMFHFSSCRAYSGDIATSTVSGIPGGSALGAGIVARSTYGSNNFYRDATATWAAGAATGTHRSYIWGNNNRNLFQVQYDPPIVKSATQQLIINQRYSWARR